MEVERQAVNWSGNTGKEAGSQSEDQVKERDQNGTSVGCGVNLWHTYQKGRLPLLYGGVEGMSNR